MGWWAALLASGEGRGIPCRSLACLGLQEASLMRLQRGW